jgi:hypothetical protein
MGESFDELLAELLDFRLKSVEFRKNQWEEGDETKTEYVAIGRSDRYMVRASGSTLFNALDKLNEKAD